MNSAKEISSNQIHNNISMIIQSKFIYDPEIFLQTVQKHQKYKRTPQGFEKSGSKLYFLSLVAKPKPGLSSLSAS